MCLSQYVLSCPILLFSIENKSKKKSKKNEVLIASPVAKPLFTSAAGPVKAYMLQFYSAVLAHHHHHHIKQSKWYGLWKKYKKKLR